MYTPGSFKVEDSSVLHQLIRDFNFGILFSRAGENDVATHLPFLLDESVGKFGTLEAHLARANPHWKHWNEETKLLVVFQGPHTYISPAWYENKVAVPTWNYAAVHVYGRPQLIHEPELLRPLVERLIDNHEKPLGYPWDKSQMDSILESQLKSIVGFRIEIETIEGKYKFNQNRSKADQEGVVKALENSDFFGDRQVAEVMRANLLND